jgi:hypothetical protein
MSFSYPQLLDIASKVEASADQYSTISVVKDFGNGMDA